MLWQRRFYTASAPHAHNIVHPMTQMRKLACAKVGRYSACDMPSMGLFSWKQTKCYTRGALPPELQTSDFPAESEANGEGERVATLPSFQGFLSAACGHGGPQSYVPHGHTQV